MNYFRKTCLRLVDVLLPQRCELCQQATDSAAPVCARCHAGMQPVPSQCCPSCADFSAAGARCGRCLKSPPSFDHVISPYLYADTASTLIQGLKYHQHLRLARWMGQQIALELAKSPSILTSLDGIIPLPLHPIRMKQRGFNQALEIARPIAQTIEQPLMTTIATRIRDTVPQVSLPREDRQRNIRDAFECTADLSGMNLLVVDDVLTTGSSANELSRVLKLHGAASITVAAFARTHHPD